MIEWLLERIGPASIAAIGHRVVHGGVHLLEHQLITDELVEELRRTQPLDLAHLPREIALIDAFRARFGDVPQVACFDTAFHRDLPQVARLLPIPRRYFDAGVRRFGFHGLSYAYLMGELERIAGPVAAAGRIILAHLGSGASMVAVRGGKPIDTSMSFTPTAGLVMSTRPGDLDPGLLVYLMRRDRLNFEQIDHLISYDCGLIGISQTSGDTRDLLERRASDPRAAEAVELFCYQARKFIGGYAAAMGGLDMIVFAGGVGEHASPVRGEICAGLEFLGVRLEESRNAAGEAIISADDSRVAVRVMHTDEEVMIARIVLRVVELAKDQGRNTPHG